MFGQHRLTRLPDGRFAYRMKYPVNGHTHRILEPMDRMARLSSVIPPPRYPLVRFAGVLAAGSRWRKHVVPAHPPARRCCAEHERGRREGQRAAAAAAPTSGSNATSPGLGPRHVRDPPDPLDDVLAKRPRGAATDATAHPPSLLDLVQGPVSVTQRQNPDATRIDWASLLRHGLEIDALVSTRCGARMRVLSAVLDPAHVRRVLEHLGERTTQHVPSRAWDPLPGEDWGSADRDALLRDCN